MSGWFGRFGQKHPEPTTTPAQPRQPEPLSQSEIDEKEFPIASRFDTDDEETNWDDVEGIGDETNLWAQPRARKATDAQPIVPVAAPPTQTTPDPEDWDEALPAATVRTSNIQAARRDKNPTSASPLDDIWDDAPQSADRVYPPYRTTASDRATPRPLDRAVGFWAGTLQQFRRILPAPIRQLSDAILTAIVVTIVTVGIWFVDGFFVPGTEPSVATNPPAPLAASPNAPEPMNIGEPEISPEQAFIDAIESQLSDITNQYPDNIVQTLNVDIARDRLVVKLNPIWYTLDDKQQDILTDRMWLQAQTNHFSRLEIQDSQGVSIARSPVVGKHAIVLQRRQS